MEQYTIGVDLGGTTITAGLVDKDHNIVDRASCLTGLPRPSEEVEQEIAGLCRQLAEKHKFAMSDLKWVGIGTPGSVNSESGVVEFNANFGYNDWALQANMEKLHKIAKVLMEKEKISGEEFEKLFTEAAEAPVLG